MPKRTKKLTEEEVEFMLSRYGQDHSPLKTSIDTGFSVQVIKKYAIQRNVYVKRRIVTDELRLEMVRRYLDGESSWQIGKAMGFLNVCVIKSLKKSGIQLRDRSTAAKTYEVNQEYFKEIDSPTKAYILGLIWSDGNIFKNSFTLALKDSDKYLLESVRQEIQSTGPLNFRKRQEPQFSDMWALRVHDKKFCSFLKGKGIVERKTSKLSFPTFLKDEFYPQFILGIIDGDGCIGTSGGKIHLDCAGSESMMKELQRIFMERLGVHVSLSKKSSSKGYAIKCSNTCAIKVLNYLYQNPPPFFMKRKYEIYTTYINTVTVCSRTHDKTIQQLKIASTIISKNVQTQNPIPD